MLTGAQGGPFGSELGTSIYDIEPLSELVVQLPQLVEGSYTYREHGNDHFLIIRKVPELGGFVLVDRNDLGALVDIRQPPYISIAAFTLITLTVLWLVRLAVKFQRRISDLANTDLLTGLPNRRAFQARSSQAGRPQSGLLTRRYCRDCAPPRSVAFTARTIASAFRCGTDRLVSGHP